ncbi:MAG: hypothetical protein INF12_14660 [Methylobacterium sp.]|nr:hypothetical protein [Methylobacterium sp.]
MTPYFFFFDGFSGQSPAPVVAGDTHDGSGGKRKKWERERAEREALIAELRAKYEGIRETPQADATGDVATAVAAYAPVKAPDLPPVEQIDWARMSRDLSAVASIIAAAIEAERLKLEAQEREDEEGAAIALLLS